MASEITERVKKHRAERGIVRVEVEVPNAEDAAAVRRFARERRQGRGKPRNEGQEASSAINTSEPLASVIERIDGDRQAVLRLFAQGLAAAVTPELIARAERIARNFFEIAEMQGRAGGPKNDEIET